jgi:hypothetical protein
MGRVGRREKAEGDGRPVATASGGGQRAAGLAKAVKLIALLLSRVVGNKSDFLLQLRCSSVNKHKSWRSGATVAYCAAPHSRASLLAFSCYYCCCSNVNRHHQTFFCS